MQGAIQKWVDHSISVTVNLPNDAPEELVGEIYIKAWEVGCKGVTVYRDGSRSGVLISNDTPSSKIFEHEDAIKRPKELEAEAHVTTCKGESYNVIVGLLEGKPYEVFMDNSDNRYSDKGIIYKKSKGKYIWKNGGEPIDIRSFMTPEEEAICRLVSANLRHRVNIQFVVEQLQKTPGDMFSFTKGLARVLKKFIPDGSESTEKCSECKSKNLVYQEGCLSCTDCGSSKCG
jgi:ribonucleoside-diphosphate reductase alpha chain